MLKFNNAKRFDWSYSFSILPWHWGTGVGWGIKIVFDGPVNGFSMELKFSTDIEIPYLPRTAILTLHYYYAYVVHILSFFPPPRTFLYLFTVIILISILFEIKHSPCIINWYLTFYLHCMTVCFCSHIL